MSLLKIAIMGHPILRVKASPIPPEMIKDMKTQWLIDSMIETMFDSGGVGLAAPQVYEAVRILIMEVPNEDKEKELPLTVMINPELEFLTETKVSGWEGCLSIPEIWGEVSRYQDVRVRYLDRMGRRQEAEWHDFRAVVIQHELDHLDATLFIDRITDPLKLAFTKEYRTFWAKKE